MKYEILFNLPEKWKKRFEAIDDESGAKISHLEATLPGGKDSDLIFIDIYAGEMPEGETAEDQAFANYAETVGFEDDDEENPIVQFKFNGKNAYGFDATTEDEFPMRFISQEVKKGVLVLIVYCVQNEDMLQSTFELIERNLRVKVKE